MICLDLSGSWCIKGTGEFMIRVNSPVPLTHHDPDRSWITDPNSDHPKGTHPQMRVLPRRQLGRYRRDLNQILGAIHLMLYGKSKENLYSERGTVESLSVRCYS